MNTVKLATPDHPIHELLTRRWSPYAFSDRPVSKEDLQSLFEAARWSASSYNEQPWRYIIATKADKAEFERLLACLVEGNQAWAKNAPVIGIGCVSLNFVRNGNPNAAAIHYLGIASANLTWHPPRQGPRDLPRPRGHPALHRPGRRLCRRSGNRPREPARARSGPAPAEAAQRVCLCEDIRHCVGRCVNASLRADHSTYVEAPPISEMACFAGFRSSDP
jgi:hypothetical protein